MTDDKFPRWIVFKSTTTQSHIKQDKCISKNILKLQVLEVISRYKVRVNSLIIINVIEKDINKCI